MMRTLDPGTVVVSGKKTSEECRFVVLPSTTQRNFCALQVSGPNLAVGECFYRGGMLAKDVLGDLFEIDDAVEVRIMARDGKLKCLILPKGG